MTSIPVLQAGSLFIAAMGLHVFVWRRHHPRRHLLALAAVFFVPVLLFLAGIALYARRALGVGVCESVLLYAAFAASYIQVYPAAQASSPTLWILLMVGGREPSGISKADIQEQIGLGSLVQDRVQDLLDAGLVEQRSGAGGLSLTARGSAMVLPFILLRRFLGLQVGRG